MEEENIEARPVWKPMHLQPVFSGAKSSKLKAQSGTQISQVTQMNGREVGGPRSEVRGPTSDF